MIKMLNFKSNHTHVDGNIETKKSKQVSKKIIVASMLLVHMASLSACASEIPCEIEGDHAHYYVNSEYMGRYIVSELENIWSLKRTEEHKMVTNEEKELLDYLNKTGLYSISDNQEIIANMMIDHNDFMEYRYKYIHLMPAGGRMISTIAYSWTSNPDGVELTGEERICHYVYYAYKVTKDENGDYRLEKSKPVDDLTQLPQEYKYVSQDFYKIINLKNNRELDYENGPIEECMYPVVGEGSNRQR